MTTNPIIPSPAGYKAAGVSRRTGINMVTAGTFPKPFLVGKRQTGWFASEIDEINAARGRGDNEDQIKELVVRLHERRKVK